LPTGLRKGFASQNVEIVGVAIGHSHNEDPLQTLRDAADTLQSSKFEAAVSLAKEKMQTAVNWHLTLQRADPARC
jgi:hypothetical protein